MHGTLLDTIMFVWHCLLTTSPWRFTENTEYGLGNAPSRRFPGTAEQHTHSPRLWGAEGGGDSMRLAIALIVNLSYRIQLPSLSELGDAAGLTGARPMPRFGSSTAMTLPWRASK